MKPRSFQTMTAEVVMAKIILCFSIKFRQSVKCGIQRIVALGKVETDKVMYVLTEEYASQEDSRLHESLCNTQFVFSGFEIGGGDLDGDLSCFILRLNNDDGLAAERLRCEGAE